MQNKELLNEYEIIEYHERLNYHDQDVVLSDKENREYTAVLSCGELVEIEPINK